VESSVVYLICSDTVSRLSVLNDASIKNIKDIVIIHIYMQEQEWVKN